MPKTLENQELSDEVWKVRSKKMPLEPGDQ